MREWPGWARTTVLATIVLAGVLAYQFLVRGEIQLPIAIVVAVGYGLVREGVRRRGNDRTGQTP